MSFSFALRVAALSALLTGLAPAQDYPNESVRVIVPWAAGGSTDSIGRILAAKLTEYTGQQFIIDNRAGATGTIGHALVAKSPPDGYTLLIGSNSTFAAFLPAGTPREIVARLNKELTRALASADVKEKLFNQGIETVGSTPEEFVAYNKAESAKWGKVIREQGIKVE